MKVLVTNYRVFTWFRVCPSEEPISWCRNFVYSSLIPIIFIASVTITATSSAYFRTTILSHNMEESLFLFIYIVGFINSIYLIIVTFILRHKITRLFKSLSGIFEESKII